MSHTVKCTSCGKLLMVPTEYSGQFVLCRSCWTWVEVPALGMLSAPSEPALRPPQAPLRAAPPPPPPPPAPVAAAVVPPAARPEPQPEEDSDLPIRFKSDGDSAPRPVVPAVPAASVLAAVPDPAEQAPEVALASTQPAPAVVPQVWTGPRAPPIPEYDEDRAAELREAQLRQRHRDQWRMRIIVACAIAAVVGVCALGIWLLTLLSPTAARDEDAARTSATAPVSPSALAQRGLPEWGPASQPIAQSFQAGAAVMPVTTGPTAPEAGPVAIPRGPRPRPAAIPVPKGPIADDQIGRAITRGVDHLLAQFDGQQLHQSSNWSAYYAGQNALAVYALLQAGLATPDRRLSIRSAQMKGLLAQMKRIPIEGNSPTYCRAVRATALAVYNRPEDRALLQEDVTWLLKASHRGAFTYGMAETSEDAGEWWDNSNSQYGLLGVWSGAEVAIEVPPSFWVEVEQHWTRCQRSTGEWGYRDAAEPASRLSMTLAGIASLFVTHDYLQAPRFDGNPGRQPFSEPLARGLAWLETSNNAVPVNAPGYTLYGLERVGLASGFKYLGEHDWYRELAADLVARQSPEGGFGDVTETCFALLFLSRGRHPILYNKLRFDGAWNNRPRDIANLARFASHELERPVNWQVVPLHREASDWMDCPVLFLASHEPPRLGSRDEEKLRQFVQAGGLLFSQADGDSPAFSQFIEQLGRRLFPALSWVDLPTTHAIFRINYRLASKPPLRCLSNGVRILMLHSPADLSQRWQLRAERTHRSLFELGVNIFVYATGKTDPKNRLDSPYLPPPPEQSPPRPRLTLARVRHGGNWDPEPYALQRFARWFEYQTGYGLAVQALEPEQLSPQACPLAHLTGTSALTLSEAQVNHLRSYVEAGGVLFIDSCGGGGAFNASVESLLARSFAGAVALPLPAEHPLLVGKGEGMDNLPKPQLRRYAQQELADRPAQLLELRTGRGRVLFSPLDLVSGFLGTNTWGIAGYDPDDAQRLMKNAVLWAWDGAEQGP